MSIRAAARFAEGANYGLGVSSLHGFAQPRSSRLFVVMMVGIALLAAGGVGTALAFRFGGGHHPARTPTTDSAAP